MFSAARIRWPFERMAGFSQGNLLLLEKAASKKG